MKASFDTLVRKLKQRGVEAVAISLLFSFLHPEHEERIASALASLDVPLSISSRILPEYREYERTSTVVINAYLQPLMGRYLKRLSATGAKHKVQAQSARDAILRRQHLCRRCRGGASAHDSFRSFRWCCRRFARGAVGRNSKRHHV